MTPPALRVRAHFRSRRLIPLISSSEKALLLTFPPRLFFYRFPQIFKSFFLSPLGLFAPTRTVSGPAVHHRGVSTVQTRSCLLGEPQAGLLCRLFWETDTLDLTVSNFFGGAARSPRRCRFFSLHESVLKGLRSLLLNSPFPSLLTFWVPSTSCVILSRFP